MSEPEQIVSAGDLRSHARLGDYRQLFAGARFDPDLYFGSFPASLPFRLGESQAEAAIPFVFSDEIVELASKAASDLIDLVRRRKEGEGPRETQIFLEDQIKLPPARFFPGRLTEGSFIYLAAERALRLDPNLDAGLMEAWLARSTAAGRLSESIHLLGVQALEADLEGAGGLPYLYMVSLALTQLAEGLKSFAKEVQIKNLSYERLEKTFGLAFFAAFSTVIQRVLDSVARRSLSFEVDLYTLRVRLALNPLLYCSIRKSVLINDVNPYAVSPAFANTLEPAFVDLIEQDPDPRGIERRLTSLLGRDKPLGEMASRAGQVQTLREAVLGFLARFDAFDEDLTSTLVGALGRDTQLFDLMLKGKEILGRVQPLTGRKLTLTEANVLKDFRTAIKGEGDRAVFIRRASQSFLVLALDRFAVGHLEPARERLRNRRGEYTPDRLEAEFQKGTMYRFGADGLPFLRTTERASQGHLFIDLKGFTSRTYRAKEVVMADFLRTEFYEPMIRAARKYAQPSPGRGAAISLQNLLGDAAVFSGDVRLLLLLARDIQRHLAAYGEKLKAAVGEVAAEAMIRRQSLQLESDEKSLRLQMEASMLESELRRKRSLDDDAQEGLLWDMFARRLFALEKRREEATMRGLGAEAEQLQRSEALLREERDALGSSLESLEPPDRRGHIDERVCAPERARLGEISRELKELEETTRVLGRALEEEERSASGYGLEAGLFVTYGAAAEVVEIEDPGFGKVKVAIAEKINEAARGTARNSHIKAKLDTLLAQARQRNPKLELPFSVYVDRTYNLVFTPELTALVDAAITGRDSDKVLEVGRQLGEGVIRDVVRMSRKEPDSGMLGVLNDIYNVGEAFSVEAMEAFLRETKTTRFAFRKNLAVSDLNPQFREKFCFVSEALELQVSAPLSGEVNEFVVFRLAGHVHFRGFEAKRATGVYELVRKEGQFFKLLAAHHLKNWLAEAREQGGRSHQS